MNLLGLEGFVVVADETVADDDGHPAQRLLTVNTVNPDVPICCLGQRLIRKGTKTVRYRDLKMGNLPTWLLVRRQRYRCECDRVIYERLPHVEVDHQITTRLRDAVRLSAVKRTFVDTVAFHGIEETLATRIFRTYADEQLMQYRYTAPRVLGIDENMLLKGLRGVIVDVEQGNPKRGITPVR